MSNPYLLSHGSHATADEGRCAMEWVSFLAGEKHSDRPVCVSPMLTSFCISLNDALPDGQRQRLRPYLARTIGTRGDGLDGERRWLCADWLFREHTPAWLDLVPGLRADAEALRSLPPVLAAENVERAMVDLNRAQANAHAAAAAGWAAAENVERAMVDLNRAQANAHAAAAAGWAAAGAAAWDAAGAAARDAAGAAARAAAWAAAGAAADAARAALAPTVKKLQDSILSPGGLLDRMLPTELIRLPVVGEWREVCALTEA